MRESTMTKQLNAEAMNVTSEIDAVKEQNRNMLALEILQSLDVSKASRYDVLVNRKSMTKITVKNAIHNVMTASELSLKVAKNIISLKDVVAKYSDKSDDEMIIVTDSQAHIFTTRHAVAKLVNDMQDDARSFIDTQKQYDAMKDLALVASLEIAKSKRVKSDASDEEVE